MTQIKHFMAPVQVPGKIIRLIDKVNRRIIYTILMLCIIGFFHAVIANAACGMEFSTKYSIIHYSEYNDMDDFLWRLGGQRIDFLNNNQLASSRIDRIVDRIQTILGVIPRDLRFSIYLRRGRLEGDKEAYYDHKTKAIYISIDHMSENVLAHEIAHAIIDKYFPSSAPSKIQEIISQYVDKYLWSDY